MTPDERIGQRCPRCWAPSPDGRPPPTADESARAEWALSRTTRDENTVDAYVCQTCGAREAERDAAGWPSLPPETWPVPPEALACEDYLCHYRDHHSELSAAVVTPEDAESMLGLDDERPAGERARTSAVPSAAEVERRLQELLDRNWHELMDTLADLRGEHVVASLDLPQTRADGPAVVLSGVVGQLRSVAREPLHGGPRAAFLPIGEHDPPLSEDDFPMLAWPGLLISRRDFESADASQRVIYITLGNVEVSILRGPPGDDSAKGR